MPPGPAGDWLRFARLPLGSLWVGRPRPTCAGGANWLCFAPYGQVVPSHCCDKKHKKNRGPCLLPARPHAAAVVIPMAATAAGGRASIIYRRTSKPVCFIKINIQAGIFKAEPAPAQAGDAGEIINPVIPAEAGIQVAPGIQPGLRPEPMRLSLWRVRSGEIAKESDLRRQPKPIHRDERLPRSARRQNSGVLTFAISGVFARDCRVSISMCGLPAKESRDRPCDRLRACPEPCEGTGWTTAGSEVPVTSLLLDLLDHQPGVV